MTFKVSTGARDYMLSTGSLKAAFAAGFIKIYSGAAPATADAAVTGTLLCTIYSNGTSAGISFDTASAAGVLAKAPGETWSQTSITTTGTAGYYRFIAATGDDGTLSTTQKRLQGTCGLAGEDMNLSSLALVQGQPQTIDYYVVSLPTL